MTRPAIADKYISPGGRIQGKSSAVDDLLALGYFLAWQPPGAMWGGVKAEEAWLAMCRLLDVPSAEFRRAIKSEP